MNKCKMCGEDFHPEDGKETDNICESCFVDDFESLNLEDKLEIAMRDPDRLREDKEEHAAYKNFNLIYSDNDA